MKFGIDIGHNCNGDMGAIGIKKEDDLNIEVGVKVINKLKKLGYNVIVCNPKQATTLKESLYKRVQIANINKVDIYVSIHFNSGEKNGVEAYAVSEEEKNIAENILSEMEKLGYRNIGVKDGEEIYTLKNTNAKSVLINCGSIDSVEDMKRYSSHCISNAIVKGLTGKEFNNRNQCNCFNNINTQTVGVSTQVLKVQQLLNRLKIDDYRRKALKEDGIMKNKTISAIKKFQSIVGLKRTGSLDKKTLKALDNIKSKPILKQKICNPRAIRYVQWRMGCISDGVFGTSTRNAVIKYQRKNKLNTDGIIGDITWCALTM